MNRGKNERTHESAKKKKQLPKFFSHNTRTKFLAALFAFLLWVYVLSVIDPIKKVTYRVPVIFDHETELNEEAGLVIASEPGQVLQEVSVTVAAKVSEISMVNPSNISAVIDLSDVRTAGTKSLKLEVSSKIGTVQLVSPSFASIDFDARARLTVPIDIKYYGEIPEGYWRGEPELNPSEIQLVGPKSEINKVKSAVCYVTIDGRTQSINEAEPVMLLDRNGDTIDDTNFSNTLSSIGLKLPIYPTKTVQLSVDESIQGISGIREGFELKSYILSPGEIVIAGPKELLDSINELSVNMLNLNDAAEPMEVDCPIRIPNGVVWSNFSSTFVYIDISERRHVERMENFQIAIQGLSDEYTAKLSLENASISVSGPKSQIEALRRSDVRAYVDLSNMGAGISTQTVIIDIPDELKDLEASCIPSTVTVTITER